MPHPDDDESQPNEIGNGEVQRTGAVHLENLMWVEWLQKVEIPLTEGISFIKILQKINFDIKIRK